MAEIISGNVDPVKVANLIGELMDFLISVGRIAGAIGVLLCIVSVAVRLGGAYWIGGFQVGTLLQGGIATMVFGCFCMLYQLTRRS